jgi:hypothetical protein
MSDYDRVKEALGAGADPKYLCMTCPWDRYCIVPPTMTKEDIDASVKKAQEEDEEKDRARGGKREGIPMGMLMTTLIYAGKDRSAEICPVFALRLRSSTGREISDSLKTQTKEFEEESPA